MGVCTHAACAGRCEFLEFGNEFSILVKQFLGFLLVHPLFENAQLFRVFLDISQRDLVGTPKSFKKVTTYLSRSTPSFRGTQYNHRPARPLGSAPGSAFLLMSANFCDAVLHGGCHRLVHTFRIGSLDEVRRPTITLH